MERRFELPEGLGVLSIMLDSNLSQRDHWSARSDYKCSEKTVDYSAFTDWPIARTKGVFNRRDSMFQFFLSVDAFAMEKCDSAVVPRYWYPRRIYELKTESPSRVFFSSGLIKIHGVDWAFIYTSDSLDVFKDHFLGYTVKSGRAVELEWHRIAPSRAAFNFEAYSRRQLATARFD